MLTIKNICKQYKTGDLVQKALDDVSLTLRDNEFVCVLGPSGSGKTTLLNIIGGLDRYDSGDLIINNISTKKYSDRDWDSYRNHTIGFVFQSYNLIPHQSILSNVELALTISGISKKERVRRATEALDKVGLKDQAHKKPNQMSGGQMQRVAIARALVNDPDILLADEPTGALDSETSLSVMNLLKEVAKDRLVVMVTHNPELADTYATRIVKLKDGRIVDDTNPCEETVQSEPAVHKNMGKSSMSFFTALSLSFNNLITKKGRTILTSFAGSIGIIGIALIMALSNGVNTYITNIQKSTMTNYPISVTKTAIDLNSFMDLGTEEKDLENREANYVYSNIFDLKRQSLTKTSVVTNNLKDFKLFLDDENCDIYKYIGVNGIVYNYDVDFDVYAYDSKGVLINTDGSTLSTGKSSFMMNFMSSSNNFDRFLPGANGELISPVITSEYEVLYGRWPESKNEVVLIVDSNNEVLSGALYKLGFFDSQEYVDIMKAINEGKEPELPVNSISYENICSKSFYILTSADYYVKNENGLYKSVKKDTYELENLVKEKGYEIKISGIVRSVEDSMFSGLSAPIGYTKALNDYIMESINSSEAVRVQTENSNTSIFTGLSFNPETDELKAADFRTYVSSLTISEKSTLYLKIAIKKGTYTQDRTKSEIELAGLLDSVTENSDTEELASLYDQYVPSGTYQSSLDTLGVIDYSNPSSIDLYVDTFENKDKVKDVIASYNAKASDENKITYTDYVGLIMSSVTTIVNVISYVLMAFVGVSLVVSSIMIGIITYISVLERTKEIGILRAIGASKGNISQVFNAETFIIGLLSGAIGIGVTELLIIPINLILHAVTGYNDVNAILPIFGALVLIVLSVLLTLVGGLIPSRYASKKDPVIALRTE